MEVPAVHFSHTAALIKQELTDSDLGLMQSDYIQSGILQTQYSLQVSTPPYWIKHEPTERSPELSPPGGVFQNMNVPTAGRYSYCSQGNNAVKPFEVQRDIAVETKFGPEKDEHLVDDLESVSNHKTSATICDLGDRPNTNTQYDRSALYPPVGNTFAPFVNLENIPTTVGELDCKDTVVMLSNYAKSGYSVKNENVCNEDKQCSKMCFKVSDGIAGTAVDNLHSINASTSAEAISVSQGLETNSRTSDECEPSESIQHAKRERDRLKRWTEAQRRKDRLKRGDVSQASHPIPWLRRPRSVRGLLSLPTDVNSQHRINTSLATMPSAKAQPGPKYLSELTTEEVEDLKRLPVDRDEDTLEPVFRVKCNTCSWAFRDLNSLVTHMSQQHDTSLEEPLRCELCEKSVRSEDHFFFYHEPRVRVCTICGLSVDHMDQHMKSHNSPYGCRTCGKRFRHLSTIKEHLLEFEKHLPENKCPHCSLIIEMTGFSKHVNYHIHGFPYKCDICPYACSTASALGHHKLIHTGKKDKKCPYCDTWFLTEDRVKGHIQYKHTEKSFLCAICGVSYSVKKQFRQHMSIHDEEKKFKCDICGKKFQRKQFLKLHTQAKHESHPRVECAICGKSTSSKQALLQHMDVHRDEMPHECPVCKKKFKRKQNMKSHLRTHGEDRKFKCEVCGDGFKWAHNLRNHMKTHNANKM